MNIFERLHVLHRCWRFRLNTEVESLRFLVKQDLRGTTALDVGANRGVYSYWLSKQVGPTGRTIAFEPQPELAEYLADLKQSFRLGNLSIENIGLSDTTGSSYLVRGWVGDGGATLCEHDTSTADAAADGLETISVEIDTIDNRLIAYGSPPISFIKCDVEGHELKTFRGAIETITRHRPTLLFECNHELCNEGSLFSFLRSLGYDGIFFDGRRPVHYADFATVPYPLGANQRNYIFQHGESLARAA